VSKLEADNFIALKWYSIGNCQFRLLCLKTLDVFCQISPWVGSIPEN